MAQPGQRARPNTTFRPCNNMDTHTPLITSTSDNHEHNGIMYLTGDEISHFGKFRHTHEIVYQHKDENVCHTQFTRI